MTYRFLGQLRVALLFAVLVQALGSVAGAAQTRLIGVEEQRRILASPGAPALGSTQADLTVVEYFDFNCPFCRELAPAFSKLLETDPKVAVIYKDWPIFGGVSIYAARSALAAGWQGKYARAHEALISAPRLSQNEQVDSVLQRAGIDMARLAKDLQAHGAEIDALLSRNASEAHALGLKGTPGILVGRQVVPNISDLAGLQAAIAAARHVH
jgi:protein-disulfide isomerase